MLTSITNIARKLIGDNMLFKKIVRREFKNGHPIKATLLTLWLIPARKSIVLDDALSELVALGQENYYSQLQNLLYISKPELYDLVRIGSAHDGGYIMLDDFKAGNIAYSFGISDDVSWDKDIASRGYDVFMYDHTIDGLPEENNRFHFFRLGIADGKTQDDRLKTLEELIASNHHENEHDMILKMDVEGAEWGFLAGVKSSTLEQFSQMTFEFHGITNHDNPKQVLEVFKKINRTHQLVHIHANNNGPYISLNGKKFCSLFEFSYVRRDIYTFPEKYDVTLPISIDAANIPSIPEIELGNWNIPTDFNDSITPSIAVL